ncbi:MAG: TlpA disulfide reductase family protein [Acidobacteriota bacterium]
MDMIYVDRKKKAELILGVFILVIFFVFLQNCGASKSSETGYTINGKITGIKKGKVELAKLDLETNEKVVVDTVVLKDGKFVFQGKVESPYLHSIFINDKAGKIHFFLENSKIDIFGDIKNLDKVKISGSREDVIFRSYPINSIFEKDKGMEIISKYPQYTFSAFVAYYYFQVHSLKIDTMETILYNFGESVKKSEYYEHLIKLFERLKRVAVSQPAPEFSLPDPDGQIVHLKDFKGKYVLIDFWASWCSPCRKSNPKLVEVYKIFKERNFTILGVSVDKNREKWFEAIEDDKLTWTNLSDLKGWGDITDLYGIKAVPQNFLIDPDGIIIKKNIDTERMIEVLSGILPDK